MRERIVEINANKDVLMVRRRNFDEENGRLKRDIMSRLNKIETLEKRYEIALTAMGKDEDGQPLSITHFKIKSAQEKYMLQKEGDEIDKKIRKAEKEIVAMENTLKMVNSTNDTYKQSLTIVHQNGKMHNNNSLSEHGYWHICDLVLCITFILYFEFYCVFIHCR